jgi:MtN3 and saliva related transmembrane protein
MTGLTDAIGYAAATLTTLSFVPQVVRVVRTRDTRAISMTTYIAFCIGTVLWFAYGLASRNLPVTIANGVTLALGCVILVYKLRLG